jgi:hypothetical protein
MYRKVIHIGAEHSPNVRIGMKLAADGNPGPYPTLIPGVVSYPNYLRRNKLWDPVKKQTRLHGHFYEGEEVLLYPPEWLDAAEQYHKTLDMPHRRGIAMGVDCGMGRDLSVQTVVDDDGIVMQLAKATYNTMEIAGDTLRLMKQYHVRPESVVFDAGGGGKQIADRLREQGYPVTATFFSESPQPHDRYRRRRTKKVAIEAHETRQTYKNRRAEIYGLMRLVLEPEQHTEGTLESSFGIPEELHLLRQELAVMPLMYDSEGRMYLPPKDKPNESFTGTTIREMLGHSPDRADSLGLAVYALLITANRRSAGAL